jgi:hypothetical protein
MNSIKCDEIVKVVNAEKMTSRMPESLFPRYESLGGTEVQLHSFLISALHLGGWLTSRPIGLTPRITPVPIE